MFSARATRIIALVAAVLAAGAGATWSVESGRCDRWRADRYARRAEALARSGAVEAPRAACLRALALNHQSVRAMRALLRVLPAGDAQAALLLRVRLADLDRGDRENLRALAFAAIAAERFELAGRAASDIGAMPGGEAEAQEWQARILAARGDFAAAESAARALLARDPRNVAGRLIAALAQVFTRSPAPEAERELSELARHPGTRVEALRALREAAQRRGDPARARELAEAAAMEPRANFSDALVRAEFAVKADASRLEAQLTELTRRAGTHAIALGLIGKWLRQHGRADRVDAWVEQTAALQEDAATAQMIRAEAYADSQQWERLSSLLTGAQWRELDFLRHAFLARGAREMGAREAAADEWRCSLDAVAGGGRPIRLLAETVKPWPGWEPDWEKLMWTAAQRVENSRWALLELQRHFEARHETRSLRRVNEEWLRADPESTPAKNNFAYYSLLLGTSLERAHRLAAEVFAAFPSDPAIASTRALSLVRRGQPADALALLEKLPPSAARQPGIAACQVLALAGAGKAAEASELARSIDGGKLLPELREMLREAGVPARAQ